MSEERFIDLETRLAHQDQLLNELNDALIRQQERITQLEDLCRSLADRVRSTGAGLPDAESGDERPPHY